jgi:hypothetical protein
MSHEVRNASCILVGCIALGCADPVVSPLSVGTVEGGLKPVANVVSFSAGGVEYLADESGQYAAAATPQAVMSGFTTLLTISCNGQTRICNAGAAGLQSGYWEMAEQTITVGADHGADGDEIFTQQGSPNQGAGSCVQFQQVSTTLGWFQVCVQRQFSSNHSVSGFMVDECIVRSKGNTLHKAWFQQMAGVTLDPWSIPILQITYGAVGETSEGSAGASQTTNVCDQGGGYELYQPGGGYLEGCDPEDVIEVWRIDWWPYKETKLGEFCYEPES